ncbi:restriction endonuclease subunit S, partial [Nostoc sp.]
MITVANSKGYRCCTLGDVITLKRGYDLPHNQRLQGEVPVVSSSGITGRHDKAKVKAPGVVTGRYGTLGEVFYVEEDFWPLNTALYICDFKGNHPKFISYMLRTLGLGLQNAAGAVPGINRNVLHKIPIAIPDIQTQQRIAEILSNYDRLIDNNNRRIALLEESIHQLYKEWFVRSRFPGYESVKVVNGIPEGWKITTLSKIAKVNEQSISKKNSPEQIQYVDISSVTTGSINTKQTIKFIDAPSRAQRIVKHGDIIWSMVRPGRKAYALVLTPPENLIVSTGFAVISTKDIPFTFLYKAVTTDSFVSHMEQVATGAAY